MDFILDIMPPCILHSFTGLYCPGCGGTRAFVALSHGQIFKSFYYHPLIVYTVVCFVWYFTKRATKAISGGKVNIPILKQTTLISIAAIIVIVNWLLRNILQLGWGITIG